MFLASCIRPMDSTKPHCRWPPDARERESLIRRRRLCIACFCPFALAGSFENQQACSRCDSDLEGNNPHRACIVSPPDPTPARQPYCRCNRRGLLRMAAGACAGVLVLDYLACGPFNDRASHSSFPSLLPMGRQDGQFPAHVRERLRPQPWRAEKPSAVLLPRGEGRLPTRPFVAGCSNRPLVRRRLT